MGNSYQKGVFYGSKIDLSDGFIHFSTKNQLKTTARKHLKAKNLVLIEVDALTLPNGNLLEVVTCFLIYM